MIAKFIRYLGMGWRREANKPLEGRSKVGKQINKSISRVEELCEGMSACEYVEEGAGLRIYK